jgi:hypothetical protein
MVDVITQLIIARPIGIVSAYAIDPNHAPEWYVNIKSAEWITPKSLAIGSQIAFKAEFLGKKLAYAYEIAELVDRQKLVMRTVDGPFPMETTYTWTDINGQATLMTLRNKGNPTGFSKLFAPFMAAMMRRANNKDLKKIKEIIEEKF